MSGSFYIVNHLFDILVNVFFDVWIKNIVQRCLRAFDLRSQERFLADIHRYKQIDIRDQLGNAFKDANAVICLCKELYHFFIKCEGWVWRQPLWKK